MLSISSNLLSRRLPQLLTTLRNGCLKGIQSSAKPQYIDNSVENKLNRIDASLRRRGRIDRRDVEDVYKAMLSLPKANPPTTTQILQLIRCCGGLLTDETPQVRNDLVNDIFQSMSDKTKLDISHYNSLLQVYIDNEYNFSPTLLLNQIKDQDIQPNRVTYQRLIHAFCQLGNISGAIEILEDMKAKDQPINELIFNSLIMGYGKAGDLESAEETINSMKTTGLEPSADTYCALLCAYASNIATNHKSVDKINKVFNEMKEKEIDFNDIDLLKVIKTVAFADSESPFIDELIDKLNKSIGYNQECLYFIYDLIQSNKLNVAFKLYDTLKPNAAQLQRKSVGIPIIRYLVRFNTSPEIVIEFCEKLKSKGYNDMAMSKAAEFALANGDIRSARVYLKRIGAEFPIRPHYFWPILLKCDKESDILEVLREDMASLSGADYTSLHNTFAHYIWPKQILDTDLFIEKCKDIGFSYVLTYNALITYYIENNRIKEVADLIRSPKYEKVRLQSRMIAPHLAEAFCNNPDVQSVVKILSEFMRSPERNYNSSQLQYSDFCGRFLLNIIHLKQSDSQQLLTLLLRAFEAKGLKISKTSANDIRDRIKLSDENESLLSRIAVEELSDIPYYDADDITKPRKEMNPQELEEHLIELRSKGFNTRGVLRSLLLSYCRRTRFSTEAENDELVKSAKKRVQEIVNQLNELQYEFSNAMYASLMEFYINCGDSESAINMRNKIGNDFALDPYKVFNLAALYVKSGDINKAIELIKEEKARFSRSNYAEEVEDKEEANKSPLYRFSDRSLNRLLNAIIDQNKDANLVKQVFELGLEYSGMPVTTIMAGPIIKVNILNEDYSKALEEYENCATKYRVLPWKNQLMATFLEKGDPTSLQKVIDYSNAIHGEMNTIVELASVCISAGKLKQAKKLIDTPGLRVKQEKLEIICLKFIEDNKIEDLQQFVLMTKNMFDVNHDQLFQLLIKGCIKMKDTERALNAWTLMQEQNIQPSDQLLIQLSDFLEQNNITVPFVVPPRPLIQVETSRNEIKQKDIDQKLGKESLNHLNSAIRSGDIDEALNLMKTLEAKGESVLMSQNNSIIEALLNSDRIQDAYDLTESLIKSKRFPAPRILRYLLSKLASNGDLQKIESFKPLLPTSFVQNSWFTNIVANAYISAGNAEEFVETLMSDLKPFPLGGLLAVLSTRPDLEPKVIEKANKMSEDDDYHLPLNMVWLHYMQTERYDEANQIYDSTPKLKEFLLFTSLLDKIRETKNINMAQKLIEKLLASNLTSKSIGIAYSTLLDVYVELGEIDFAEELLIKEVVSNSNKRVDPKTGVEERIIDIEHISRPSLLRLINSIRDIQKREPKFSLPKKTFLKADESSSSGSSSDDEAVGVKQK